MEGGINYQKIYVSQSKVTYIQSTCTKSPKEEQRAVKNKAGEVGKRSPL